MMMKVILLLVEEACAKPASCTCATCFSTTCACQYPFTWTLFYFLCIYLVNCALIEDIILIVDIVQYIDTNILSWKYECQLCTWRIIEDFFHSKWFLLVLMFTVQGQKNVLSMIELNPYTIILCIWMLAVSDSIVSFNFLCLHFNCSVWVCVYACYLLIIQRRASVRYTSFFLNSRKLSLLQHLKFYTYCLWTMKGWHKQASSKTNEMLLCCLYISTHLLVLMTLKTCSSV